LVALWSSVVLPTFGLLVLWLALPLIEPEVEGCSVAASWLCDVTAPEAPPVVSLVAVCDPLTPWLEEAADPVEQVSDNMFTLATVIMSAAFALAAVLPEPLCEVAEAVLPPMDPVTCT
jgi:hypothetical protein